MNFQDSNDYKIDIIIEARMSSSRLPGKVLLPVMDKPLLLLMVERLKNVDFVSDIIIATTENQSDDVIVDLAQKEGIPFYRGSDKDVLGRVLKTAQSFSTNLIIEITGDNPLADPKLVNDLVDCFLKKENDFDIISTDMGYYNKDKLITFPLGLGGKVFETELLKEVSLKTNHPTDREHVVNYILKNTEIYKCHNFIAKGLYKRPEIRLTMDYEEDYQLIKKIYEYLYKENNNFSFSEVIKFLDANPKLKSINSHCKQKVYKY